MRTMDEIARLNGFDDEADLHRCVASVDLSDAGRIGDFRRWQYEDGTKDGLLALIKGSTGPALEEAKEAKDVERLLDRTKVFMIRGEYYAALDEAGALEARYARFGDPNFERRHVEEEADLDARHVWQGDAFTWREVVREAIERGAKLPCWVGSDAGACDDD